MKRQSVLRNLKGLKKQFDETRLSKIPGSDQIYNAVFHIFSGRTKIRLKGFEMITDTQDLLGRQILFGHENSVILKMISYISKGDLVIDAGAHHGLFSLYSRKTVGSQGSIYAFEPHPDSFKILSENVDLNGFENIRIENMCLGNSSQTTHLRSLTGLRGRSYISESEESRSKAIEMDFTESFNVEMTSLSRYMREEKIEKVDMLKVDVEGAELEVLRGVEDQLQNVKRAVIEIHSHHEDEYREDLYHLLSSNGRLMTLDRQEITDPENLKTDWLYQENSTGTSHVLFES